MSKRNRKWEKAYYATHKEQFAAHNKAQRLHRVRRDLLRLGWTPEAVNSAYALQEGCCAICGASLPLGTRKGLVPDHAHTEPPTPRALLCNRCNVGLGHFLESAELLVSAAVYLLSWRKIDHGRNVGKRNDFAGEPS